MGRCASQGGHIELKCHAIGHHSDDDIIAYSLITGIFTGTLLVQRLTERPLHIYSCMPIGASLVKLNNIKALKA
jgi:hypothetical protein